MKVGIDVLEGPPHVVMSFHSVLGLKAEIQVLVSEKSDLTHKTTQLNSHLSEQKVNVYEMYMYTHVCMSNHVHREQYRKKERKKR